MAEGGDQPTDARERLLSHFSTPIESHPSKWSALWDAGDFLPWDKGSFNPALADTLTQRQDLIPASVDESGRRRKAFVPGCGKGYDVLLLAAFGYDAFGLEISESAAKMAENFMKANYGKGDYAARHQELGFGEASFVVGDFFKDEWVEQVGAEGGFDVIYDYTFLSALPPSLRPAWSLRMSQLLAPDGRLICVEFPTYKPHSTGGPPWALPPKVYLGHLSHPGQELPYDAEGGLKEGEVSMGNLPDNALERMAHWQPERTHEIGKGTDWVSVWRRTT